MAVISSDLTVGIVVNDQFERVQDSHAAQGALVQVVTDAGFQLGHVHPTVVIRLADCSDESLDGFRGHAAPAKTAQGGETWVVPAAHNACLDQFAKFALAHHGVGQVEAGKLDLARLELTQVVPGTTHRADDE